MKFSIKDPHRKLRIWSHLLKKSVMGNFTFCAVGVIMFTLWNRDNDHVMTMNFSVTYRVLIVLSTCQTNIGHFDFLLQ